MRSIFNYFSKYSETITSVFYFIATSTLLAKSIIQPEFTDHLKNDFQTQMDIAACVPFYGSSYFYYKAKDNPNYIKRAGACVLMAASFLIAGGYQGSLNDASFWIHAGSMLPTAWAGFAFCFGKRTLGATPELISRPFHAAAGLMQNDPGQIIFALNAAVAEVGLIASDKKLKHRNNLR